MCLVPFLAVLVAAWEAVTPSGGPGKKYPILQGLGQAGGTKAVWRDEHHPLSSAAHPALSSTASGCCFSWLAASPAWFSFSQRKAPHLPVPQPEGVLCWPMSFLPMCCLFSSCLWLLFCQPWSGQSYGNSLIVSSTGCSATSLVTSTVIEYTKLSLNHISKKVLSKECCKSLCLPAKLL